MSCPNLLPGWEEDWGYIYDPDDCQWERLIRDGIRKLYRYTATGHLQPNFPRVGDEFLNSNPIQTEALFSSTSRFAFAEIVQEKSMQKWYSQYILEHSNEMRYPPTLSDWFNGEKFTSMKERDSRLGVSMMEVLPTDLLQKWVIDSYYEHLQKPWITHSQEHESIDYNSLDLIWVETMSPDLKAKRIDYLSNIFSLVLLGFAFSVLCIRYISLIIGSERFPQRHRSKSHEKHSKGGRRLVLRLHYYMQILALGIGALLILLFAFSDKFFFWAYDAVVWLNLIPTIIYVTTRQPPKNLVAWFMLPRMDRMLSREWYETLLILNFFCFSTLLLPSAISQQLLSRQAYPPFRHEIFLVSVLVGWNFRPDIIDRSLRILGQHLRQLKGFAEITPGIGRVRMDWECHCGKRYSDYFFESEPGAVQRMADRMCDDGSIRQGTATTQPLSIFSVLSRSLSNLFSSLGRLWRKEARDTLPNIELSDQLRNNTASSDYLLLCIKESKYTTAMSALSIRDVKSDFELFEAIRGIYMSRRLKIFQSISFTTVKRIDFVKFLLCESSLVDCIKRNQLPPKTVEFYAFDPRKPRVIPPIGTDFLLHRFHNPKCGSGKYRCLKQFPKRLGQRPQPGQPPDYDVGWGVHIVEGPHFAMVMTWHIAVATVGSLLFGVLYWYFERDVSGAFTVSAYMTSLTSLLVGAWQVWTLLG